MMKSVGRTLASKETVLPGRSAILWAAASVLHGGRRLQGPDGRALRIHVNREFGLGPRELLCKSWAVQLLQVASR